MSILIKNLSVERGHHRILLKGVGMTPLALVACCLIWTGCNPPKEEEHPAADAPSRPAAPAAPASTGALESLGAPAPAPPPLQGVAAAPEASSLTPATEGTPASPDAALALLENAAEHYTRELMTRVPADEEEAQNFKPVPPLTNLEQLVQYRLIRAVPAAPPGKKFIYDAKDGKVKLVTQ